VLYQLHELQRAFLGPLSGWAEASAQLYTNPYSPLSYTPVSRRVAAALDLTHRLGKTYEKPTWDIDTVDTPTGRARVEIKTIKSKPFCHLLRFEKYLEKSVKGGQKPVSLKNPGPQVFLVAPMSGHHATLLRDTVSALLCNHDVYVTDWVDARMVPLVEGPFHLDDYVFYVQDFLRLLGPETAIISVCQPTVPVLAAVSLLASQGDPCQPKAMVMMGGPIDTRKGPTSVNDLAKDHSMSWFERNMIYSVPQRYPGYLRSVYPGFLQYAGFVTMNPGRHANSHYDYFQHLMAGDDEGAEAHRKFYDEYNAVLDLAGEFYLDTIRIVFQEHALPCGHWKVGDELVRPQDVKKTALFTIEGELDDISGPGQTRAAHKLCSGIPESKKQDFKVPGAGHYGIFSGRRWRNVVAPRITQFIQKHVGSEARAR
jgi:poly(3-hydroxybutyrate) depolymerase